MNEKPISTISVLFYFFSAALGACAMLLLWAKVFTGHWHEVNFEYEFFNAVLFAPVCTALVIVARHVRRGRARTLLMLGFSVLSTRVVVEIPLQKLVATYPELAASIRPWFFSFGLAEFVGVLLVFFGIAALIEMQKNKTP